MRDIWRCYMSNARQSSDCVKRQLNPLTSGAASPTNFAAKLESQLAKYGELEQQYRDIEQQKASSNLV